MYLRPYIMEWYHFQNHWLYVHRAQRITLLSYVQKLHSESLTMHYFNAVLHEACVQHIQQVLLNWFPVHWSRISCSYSTLLYKTDLRFISKHLLTAQNELQQRQETMAPTSPSLQQLQKCVFLYLTSSLVIRENTSGYTGSSCSWFFFAPHLSFR